MMRIEEGQKLWRATEADETGIPVGSCWAESRSDAEAYRDNPGFGGPSLRSIEASGRVLDLGFLDRDAMIALADLLGLDGDGESWWLAGYQYPWEEVPGLMERLADVADWVRYEDDYPEQCMTWMRV